MLTVDAHDAPVFQIYLLVHAGCNPDYSLTGYLFTNWDHIAAATGRLTSANPNIQSVPKETLTLVDSEFPDRGAGAISSKVGLIARNAFISHDGYTFLSAGTKQ